MVPGRVIRAGASESPFFNFAVSFPVNFPDTIGLAAGFRVGREPTKWKGSNCVMGDHNISYEPTDGLSYRPDDPKYFNKELLQKEVLRAFELCQGCRMCFKYCDSFPTLFQLLDEKYEGDVRRVTPGETDRIMDLCFQCKLCEVQCPYTPRDNHPFQFDFPKLVHRYRAIAYRSGRKRLRYRLLGDPDASGKMARMSLGMANRMNRVKLHRWLLEKALGIHRKKLLPDFAATTFERWAKQTGRMKSEGEIEAVLFQTCFVQNNEPHVGRDTVEVLEKNGVRLSCVEGLQCCGMPVWEHGDLTTLRERARHNLRILLPWVQKGAKVLVINPTCSMMMRREYPELVAPEDHEVAKQVAEAIRDVGEFLWSIRNETRFNTEFRSSPGKVAYHAPCHLRAQGVGFKGRDLLKKIPGASAAMTLECCGHDGTFAMTVEGFEISEKVGTKAFDGMKQAEADTWVTDCPLAAVQFEQFAGKKPLHPMSVLAKSYREDGFVNKVQ